MMYVTTVDRVPRNTAGAINEQIRAQTRRNVARLACASPQEIERRLRELDAEWDIERVLEANASLAMLASVTLGATADRRWLALSGLIAGFLLQHAVQGWCPPVPVLRRMGFRTSYEIDEERYALKAIRGDFKKIDDTGADEDHIRELERLEGEGGTAFEEPPCAKRDAVDSVLEAVRS